MDRRTFTRLVAVSVLATPRLVSAQHGRAPYHVGFLTPRVAPPMVNTDLLYGPFVAALGKLGYVEDQNLVVTARFAGGSKDALASAAAELVRMPVDVIVTQGPAGLRAAFAATRTIPIVMVWGSSDPVGDGIAKQVGKPGLNVTGLAYAASPQRFQKELEYLKQAAPAISRIAVAWDFEDLASYAQTIKGPLDAAARNLGLTMLPPVKMLDAAGVEPAFAQIKAQQADALLILVVGSAREYRERIAAAAIANRLPTVAAFRIMAEGGVLMSYGPDESGNPNRAAYYVDRILKGTKPGDLPIEFPRKDSLILNLGTAKALGITFPQALRVRADDVVY